MLTEWNNANVASTFLRPCSRKHLNEELGPLLERKSGNAFNQTHARSGGWLYHRHDLERVRAIMDALGCKATRAVWLYHATKELNARQMIPFLTEELRTTIKREAAQRRESL